MSVQEIIWFHVVRVARSWCGPLPSKPCCTHSRTMQLMSMPWPGALQLCTAASILWLQPLRIRQSGMLRHACTHCCSMHLLHLSSCSSEHVTVLHCFTKQCNGIIGAAVPALHLMVPQSIISHNAVDHYVVAVEMFVVVVQPVMGATLLAGCGTWSVGPANIRSAWRAGYGL